MVELPTGTGHEFARAARQLIEEARRHIGTAFESRELCRAAQKNRESAQAARGAGALRAEGARATARSRDRAHPGRPADAPVAGGKPLPPQQFETLPAERQRAFRGHLEEVESRAPVVRRKLRELERDGQQQLEALDREVAHFAAGHLVDELKQRWSEAKVQMAGFPEHA